MKLKKYSLDQLKEAIASSISVRQTLNKLNVKAAGGNYYIFHKAINHFKLDTSHFTGQDISGRKLPLRRKPINEYLTKDSGVQSNKLRKYLLDEKIFEHKCSSCTNTTWLDNLIPLELDHIDGDNTNNKLANLRLLCPNCHSLTPTYRGRNITKA